MINALLKEDVGSSAVRGMALLALRKLPDRCSPSVGDLARRIGADKLDLLQWVRADIEFARLIASKVTT